MKAIDITSFFIEKGVSPLKLQKLLFYSQVWYFIKKGKILFDDDIQAWVLGPVVYDVWSNFKFIRRGDIINKRHIKEKIKDIDIIAHLEEIWNVYGKYTGLELVELTHSEKLWIEARNGSAENARSNSVINIDNNITSYFKLNIDGKIPFINDGVIKTNVNFRGNVGEQLF